MTMRVTSQLVVESIGFRIVRTDIAGTLKDISLEDGSNYYVIGDGDGDVSVGPDILAHMQAKIRAASAEFLNFRVLLSADGLVQIATPAGSGHTATLTWVAGAVDGTQLRDWFRYTGATLAITDDETVAEGDYIHQGGLYPNKFTVAIDDLPIDDPRTSQSVVDDGSLVNDISWAEPVKWFLRFSSLGFPYSLAGRNDFHALRSLMQHLSLGHKFRYYRDEDVTTEYAEGTNPTGWTLLQLDGASKGWRPTPVNGGIYNKFEKALEAWRV